MSQLLQHFNFNLNDVQKDLSASKLFLFIKINGDAWCFSIRLKGPGVSIYLNFHENIPKFLTY